jgi:transcriptional regulator with PAS, ATPase and Fis domain
MIWKDPAREVGMSVDQPLLSTLLPVADPAENAEVVASRRASSIPKRSSPLTAADERLQASWSTVLTMTHASDAAVADVEAHDAERRLDALIEDLGFTDSAVGSSPGWRGVLRRAIQVAATDTTTCLEGESGVGKEVVARLIHRASPRRHGPFVAINCAAIPESLFESELFGFERGAFTGAHQAKPGQIELAAGGVLFLDEVGEMTPGAQAKVLRVLEEREFRRLGATRVMRANLRVIAATNRDLDKAVARGHFRVDLYYRLKVFDIRIPPLRERPEDIVMLAQLFLRQTARSTGRTRAELTPAARETLLRHEWPGNVRELHNALERATIVCADGLIRAEDLSITAIRKPIMVYSADLTGIERQAIERAMRDVGGNKSKAALQLGISRTQLYTRLRKHGLERHGRTVSSDGLRFDQRERRATP